MSPRNQNPPKRPLPREIYMRRRIAAGVVLLVVILLLWWLISSLSGGDKDQSVAQSEVATSRSIDATSPAEPPHQTDKKSSEPSKTESSTKDEKGDEKDDAKKKEVCTVADLKVTATPGAPTFGADQQPNFFVNIKNPTKGDCSVDFDAHKLMFEVFTLDNYQRVWGDLDCNDAEVRGTVDIKAGEEVNYELGAWSRTTSAPGRCDNRTAVGPGGFLLYAHVGDNVSEPATFNLA
ncbi:hypothetical protein [Corynebacterium sp. 321]|uniref:hypothetical protein n=1 Tax=Corynebacterium sp. 321 TaxID=2651047 RepID=UPI001CE3C0B2|nr:hypothetical protein [Corynebacterium sp. 321]